MVPETSSIPKEPFQKTKDPGPARTEILFNQFHYNIRDQVPKY